MCKDQREVSHDVMMGGCLRCHNPERTSLSLYNLLPSPSIYTWFACRQFDGKVVGDCARIRKKPRDVVGEMAADTRCVPRLHNRDRLPKSGAPANSRRGPRESVGYLPLATTDFYGFMSAFYIPLGRSDQQGRLRTNLQRLHLLIRPGLDVPEHRSIRDVFQLNLK
jgi:hypothetical protein